MSGGLLGGQQEQQVEATCEFSGMAQGSSFCPWCLTNNQMLQLQTQAPLPNSHAVGPAVGEGMWRDESGKDVWGLEGKWGIFSDGAYAHCGAGQPESVLGLLPL
jgi:hypothetical protein